MNKEDIFIDPEDFGCSRALVTSVNVSEGQTVIAGETLVEFECEKSTFEVSMPSDGIVEKCFVEENNFVEERTAIVRIQSSAPSEKLTPTNDTFKMLEQLKQEYTLPKDAVDLKEAINWLNASCVIRPSKTSDASSFAKIYEEVSQIVAGKSTVSSDSLSGVEWFKEAIESSGKTFFSCVLVSDNAGEQVIGFINLEKVSRTPQINYYFLGLYVTAPNLSWTAGRALLTHAIDYSRRSGIKHLIGFTCIKNTPAINLVQSLGFSRSGQFKIDPHTGNPCEIFELKI